MKPFNEEDPIMGRTIDAGDWAMHGDVLIFGETDLPANFNKMDKVDDSCLAYGELTGHVHKIMGEPEDYELKEDPETKVRHLKVVRPVMLKHQEHRPIEIHPGNYRIGIQREYDPWTKRIREVAD